MPDLDGRRLLIERAEGAYVWDADGRRYVDTVLGFGATVLGHAHAGVLERVSAAMARGPMPGLAHESEARAAAALAECTAPLDRVVFVSTGSEAVHLACRIARAATGRPTVAKAAGAYHGWYDGLAFANAGSEEALPDPPERPTRGGVTLLRFNDRLDVDRLFAERDDIAAVLVEPLLANAGCIEADPGYLAHLATTARRHGALVIADEVLTGFRIRPGLCAPTLGLEPDLATLGKAIGSGFAVAAVAGTAAAMEPLDDGSAARAGTYSGNPVACAAVLASLQALTSLDFDSVVERGDDLRAGIVTAFTRRGLAASTSGYGTVFTIWPAAEAPRDYPAAAALASPPASLALHERLRAAGALVMPSPFGRLFLSAAHDGEALAALASCFETAAGRIAAGWPRARGR